MEYELHIISNSERKKLFKSCVAGGYCGHTNYGNIFKESVWIKIFIRSDCPNYEECTAEIITHEILHLVLDEVEGEKTDIALDNIHKPLFVLDVGLKKLNYVVEFVHKKKRGKIVTII